MSDKTKYIFITGGVVSSLGKGIASASMGSLLEACGQRITFVKLDPYINLDPGTMSPFQHGEVYVTEDGVVNGVSFKTIRGNHIVLEIRVEP